jgi:hypothetical protein
VAETEPLEPDTPLRPVDAEDLARVWRLVQKVITDHGKGVGIDARMISQQCSPGVDVHAVFFRAALLQHLFESGLLNPWREGDEPASSVFQVAAIFPIEQGARGFDPESFIERLRSEK